MQNVEGVWFPDSERHLIEMIKLGPRIDGRGSYQHHKLTAALNFVKQWDCALDIGMHVGLWAMHLTKKFKTVIGFEPVMEHIDCLQLNMKGVTNYEVLYCALGNRSGEVGMRFMNGSTGSTQVEEYGKGIALRRLDDVLAGSKKQIGFIKIDVEGYEYFVVAGGEQIIKTHKPVIILEQKRIKPNRGKSDYGRQQFDARDLLVSWGAKQRFEMYGDCCLSW